MTSQKQQLLKRFMAVSGKWMRIMKPTVSVSIEERVATILQAQALTYLKVNPKTTVGELAQELVMSSAAIAKFTDRLFSAGWILREDDPHDRRITRLLLTKKGKDELKQMQKRRYEKINEITSFMPENDLKEMVRIMENLAKNWEKNKYL